METTTGTCLSNFSKNAIEIVTAYFDDISMLRKPTKSGQRKQRRLNKEKWNPKCETTKGLDGGPN